MANENQGQNYPVQGQGKGEGRGGGRDTAPGQQEPKPDNELPEEEDGATEGQ